MDEELENLTVHLVMANYNFSAEAAENYEQKCLCVLVLDTSGSMNELIDNTGAVPTGKTIESDGRVYNVVVGGVSKLDSLNEGLFSFFEEIVDDETTNQRLELSIITFNDIVEIIQEPALPCNVAIQPLTAKGETALVEAVFKAIDLVAARKEWYKQTNQPYYRPWIILMTDGEPNKGRDINELAGRIKADTADAPNGKKYVFVPIGVDNANMSVLQTIQGSISPMKLKGAKFSSFFKWLSASMGTIVNSEDGKTVNLTNGSDWMDTFYII